MKTIGVIGGTSWESSIEFYRILNETVKEKLGGLHSAKCLMYSMEFQEIIDLMSADDWDTIANLYVEKAKLMKAAGADFLTICSNTLIRNAAVIEKQVGIPVFSIADAVAVKVQSIGMKKVGFLGTRYAMEGDYYRDTLKDKYGIEMLIPDDDDRELVDRIIFQELCLGVIKKSSKDSYINIIEKLHKNGAEGIILGCTEIPLLIKQVDISLPVFDTLDIYATASVELALK